MKQIGFSNEKYLTLQSEQILERVINQLAKVYMYLCVKVFERYCFPACCRD
jgi:uncharacterized protein (UPF0371 family)